MNTILNRIDRLMMAITFAEANEPKLAQECLGSRKPTMGRQPKQTTKMSSGQAVAHHTAH